MDVNISTSTIVHPNSEVTRACYEYTGTTGNRQLLHGPGTDGTPMGRHSSDDIVPSTEGMMTCHWEAKLVRLDL